MVENSKKSYWHDSLVVFARMSGWVTVPVIIGLFIGRWIDSFFSTAPLFFAVTIAFSFLFSCFGIVREAKKYMKRVEQEARIEKKD